MPKPLRNPGPPRRSDIERWPFADHLAALIASRGHQSVESAAKAMGTGPKTLRRYVSGERWPSPSSLRKILAGLDATHDDLVGALDPPKKSRRKSG